MTQKHQQLQQLTEQFKRNITQYKSQQYDESNTRTDFIDKFFELLDWDVRNNQGKSEQYREVVREDTVTIQGKAKAPDYSFRIGRGQRVFFVEAKKPSVNIKEDIAPAYQIRRYGYSAKVPLSILTDFEEFAVYDTRFQPKEKDNASVGRIFYCTYEDYLNSSQTPGYDTNFDFIYNTFSQPAIYKGSFDRYVEENKDKKGTSTMDSDFLNFINEWRIDLAKNIALRNKGLDVYNLNLAVQKIIDRILFLRIAEDKHMEDYGKLRKICDSAVTYSTLDKYFQKANDKYNSGLFKVEDWLCELQVDNKVLSGIILNLYPNACPYEFSVMPIEILGNIYEQFLGKIIRLTAGHQAKVEDKPEVRKAGGVYYTPQYIVDYIVENTVGEKIRAEGARKGNKSPKQIEKLTILDPACGSGSFLVGSYKYLLDYHTDWYNKDENRKKALKDEKIYQVGENDYRLTIEKKQKILLNNIYGVDIDSQAVEVTKLSLLLKLLEGEGQQAQYDLFKHTDLKLLPDLSNNIKCGNSLIGPDYYDGKTGNLFNNEEMRKVNAFDWSKEYPDIIKVGGFDVILGNPPYGAELNKDERNYLENKFNLRNTDTACLFMGLAKSLLNSKGINGFIIPKPFVYSSNWKVVRENVLDGLQEIVDCGKAWKEVKLEQVIYIYSPDCKNNYYISSVRSQNAIEQRGKIDKSTFNEFEFYLNGISEKELKIGQKIRNIGCFLNDLIVNQRGGMYQKQLKSDKSDIKVIAGQQIGRYFIKDNIKGYLSTSDLINKGIIKDNSILAQNIVAHIQNPIDHIKIIASNSKELDPKLYIILDTINQLDNSSDYSSEYLLGILNSKLISWYVYRFIFGKAIRTMHFDNAVTSRIPYPKLNLKDKAEKESHDQIVQLVNQMLLTQKELHSAKTDHDKSTLQKKIDILDTQIDNLVYKLYNLTDEEIKIIDNSK